MQKEPIGIQLRNKRKIKGVTIVDLAQKMGVSQAYIAKIERGEIEPNAEQIEVILNFLAQ